MNSRLKDQNGVTLIELLAVIVILGFLMMLMSNVHLFEQKQYSEQSKNTKNLNNLTYTMKEITKEVRKSKDIKVVSPVELKLDNSKYKFESTSKSITRDDALLVGDIKDFKLKQSGNELSIEITNLSNKKLNTTIMLRRGD